MKIFVNSYFSDFEPIFLLRGGVSSKSAFSKKNSFCERIFLRPILTWGNTPNRFLDFLPQFFLNFFFQKNNLHILEELRQLFDENPWRNKSSKLNIFGPLFPKTESALSFYWISEICWIYITHMVCLKDFSRKYIDLNHPAIVLLLIFQSMLTCITHMIKKHLKKVCWLESPSHCPVVDFPKYVDLHHPYD